MAEWSNASDLKSDEPKGFREFESHSLFYFIASIRIYSNQNYMGSNTDK